MNRTGKSMLTQADIAELTDFRHELHRFPEVSGAEHQTAARIVAALHSFAPDQIVPALGGHGVAAIWHGTAPGRTVMFRAELDALPITERSGAPYASTIPGHAHLCGHDGHMAILMALARLIYRTRPAAGRVILMFQPAEETGAGGRAVMADPAFGTLRPDYAFAIHNMPGLPFGHARLTDGVFSCASMGLKFTLIGKTAHAAQPETGLSPAPALAALMPALTALGAGGALVPGFRLVTVTHARMGEPAFGIAPGEAELWVTLRTLTDGPMADLHAQTVGLVAEIATRHGLTFGCTQHDVFGATVNHPDAAACFARALAALNIPHDGADLPMRASEDFGQFGQGVTKLAMILLGAGPDVAALHNPDYDFPDGLIPLAAAIFHRILGDLVG
jgi:amidohydrolase